jgi:hypothetical protein
MSKLLQFKCTLLTDVIINPKAATEGNHETLDFISGNNFLGIVAKSYDSMDKYLQLTIFHSGKVRFGDAHPLSDNFRTLRIPALMHYPKGKKVSDDGCCYLAHLYNKKADIEQNGKDKVPKLEQCCHGFYKFQDNKAQEVEVEKTFAIKSAYDRDLRKSKDSQMYGYQSIDKGNVFGFEVYIDNSLENEYTIIEELIRNELTGKKRIGRSRTAQYGSVLIEFAPFDEVKSGETITDKNLVTVYADGRLIFLDKNGIPVFTPDASQLEFDGCKVIWEKSQIRTFQYAPWNSKRQVRDADRCGIEKGSVFVLSVKNIPNALPRYIGSYQNEGFGKIIINPDFLNSKKGSNGLAKYTFSKEKERIIPAKTPDNNNPLSEQDNVLMDYLQTLQKEDADNQTIYGLVNQYIETHSGKFIVSDDAFSSQWSTIRNIATQSDDINVMKEEIFNETTGYLCSGVAKNKWAERKRCESFKDFFDKINPKYTRQVVINLAAEMAKKCSKKQEKEANK